MDLNTLKAYFNLALLKVLREGFQEGGDTGEGQFGLVPPSLDPNSALSQANKQTSTHEESLRLHPLLGKSAQFSGIDRHLTGDPISNPKARDQYPELRLQRQLRYQSKPRKSPPRLVR